MTKPASSIGDARHDPDDRDRELALLQRENGALRGELEHAQPLISAALLTATAFRLRDQDALTSALRLLVRAIRLFEDHPACVS
jgi:hypothetical protein